MTKTSSPSKEMEKLRKSNQTLPKQTKKARQREPVKVVYISSPVWVEATAAEFRARVIELTGRDSDITNMSPVEYCLETPQPVFAVEPDPDIYMAPFDMFDQSFAPHMAENLCYYGTSPCGAFLSRG